MRSLDFLSNSISKMVNRYFPFKKSGKSKSLVSDFEKETIALLLFLKLSTHCVGTPYW